MQAEVLTSVEEELDPTEFARPNNSCKQRCEVYSRVVGYFRPIAYWNKGKKAEWKDKRFYKPRTLNKLMAPSSDVVVTPGIQNNQVQ